MLSCRLELKLIWWKPRILYSERVFMVSIRSVPFRMAVKRIIQASAVIWQETQSWQQGQMQIAGRTCTMLISCFATSFFCSAMDWWFPPKLFEKRSDWEAFLCHNAPNCCFCQRSSIGLCIQCGLLVSIDWTSCSAAQPLFPFWWWRPLALQTIKEAFRLILHLSFGVWNRDYELVLVIARMNHNQDKKKWFQFAWQQCYCNPSSRNRLKVRPSTKERCNVTPILALFVNLVVFMIQRKYVDHNPCATWESGNELQRPALSLFLSSWSIWAKWRPKFVKRNLAFLECWSKDVGFLAHAIFRCKWITCWRFR